jgi:hypothetical protein
MLAADCHEAAAEIAVECERHGAANAVQQSQIEKLTHGAGGS